MYIVLINIEMIIHNLVEFYIAKMLYEIGYKGDTEYSYPVTQKGEQYKNSTLIPYIHLDETRINNTVVTKWKNDTNFKENRLAAPSIFEIQEWLLIEHNILIEPHSYNARGNFNSCKWVVDINKKPISHGSKKKLYDSRIEGINDAINKSVMLLHSKL